MPADRLTADLLRELVEQATSGEWTADRPTGWAGDRLIVALVNVAPLIAAVLDQGEDDDLHAIEALDAALRRELER